MDNSSYSHEAINWVKQRLDELDAIILEVEKSIADQSDAVRTEAETALERLKAARLTFQHQYDTLRVDATDLKQKTKSVQDALDEEWIEVETSVQSFLTTIADQAGAVRSFVAARAAAQRRSWEALLTGLRTRATDNFDRTRHEFDSVMFRLSGAAEKFQARIGDTKDAGDESWAAVKAGLSEVKAVHDRTLEKLKASVSKLF